MHKLVKMFRFNLIVSIILCPFVLSFNIDDFGAIPDNSSISVVLHNTRIIEKAIYAANSSSTDRSVVFPSNHKYFMFHVKASHMFNITIQIDGTLVVANMSDWVKANVTQSQSFGCLDIEDSENIELCGTGLFDGQGYDWWKSVFLTKVDNRPFLVSFNGIRNVYIHGLRFRNSPFWNLQLGNIENLHIRGVDIWADVEKQKELAKKFGYFNEKLSFPVFPLNTDGIDPSGRNVLIEDSTISIFDDAVAVKPSSKNSKYSNCSENMLIRNVTVNFGVGMSIGSVAPSGDINCVRNITFENIDFKFPLKAIYIKSNPGDNGAAIIDRITYRNITAVGCPWMPIWIGPQQQKQPGTTGTGCSFLYPVIDQCPTNPLVKMSNIKLENVHLEGSLLLPGVILCDEKAPCTGVEFKNVTNTGPFEIKKEYICKNVVGKSENSNPKPDCF